MPILYILVNNANAVKITGITTDSRRNSELCAAGFSFEKSSASLSSALESSSLTLMEDDSLCLSVFSCLMWAALFLLYPVDEDEDMIAGPRFETE